MEAVILGSGTSNGIPMIGYHYPPGYLDNPKNHRTRCSLLLRSDLGNVLIDCPPELRLQLTSQKVMDLDAVVISHTHADHLMGMDDLRSICVLRNKSLPIFTLPEFKNDIRRVFPYAFQEAPPGLFFPRFDLYDLPETLEVAGMTLRFFWVWHGSMRVAGVRVNDFAYVTDVSAVPEEALDVINGVKTLVIDALRREPHPNHFNLQQALDFVKTVSPERAFFTHLTHDFDHDVANKTLPPGVELAYDGLTIPV